jgi:hypothetical protein
MEQSTTTEPRKSVRDLKSEAERKESRLKGLRKGRASQRLARCLPPIEEEEL